MTCKYGKHYNCKRGRATSSQSVWVWTRGVVEYGGKRTEIWIPLQAKIRFPMNTYRSFLMSVLQIYIHSVVHLSNANFLFLNLFPRF